MADECSWALAFDIGGTKISGGLVGQHGQLATGGDESLAVKQEYDGLSEGGQQIQKLLVEIGHKLLLRDNGLPGQVVAVGVGVAGTVDFVRGRVIVDSANVPGMEDIDFPALCAEEFGLPGWSDNDVNCAAYAEAHFGAGQGCDPVFCTTLGAGIGGGLIVRGDIYRGYAGSAMEVGHTVIDYRGIPCPCGGKGHLEATFNTATIERRLAELVRQDSDALIGQVAENSQRPTPKDMFKAARRDDPAALRLVDELTDVLAAALGTVCSLLVPEIIVIGGGMSQAGDVLFTRLREKLLTYIAYPEGTYIPPVVPAALGPEATLVGAGALALSEQGKLVATEG